METEIEIIDPQKINVKKILGITLILAIVFCLVFFGMRAYRFTKKIIVSKSSTASPYLSGGFDLNAGDVSSEDRRINILLLGIGGEDHPGGNLTDTMLVASLDPKNKELAILSIPRDLYLKVEGYGYQKINSVLSLGAEKYKDDPKKYELVKNTVSSFLGVPIHYFGLVSFNGFKEIIDIIGGIDVDVKEDLYDPYFPDQYVEGYEEFYIEKGWNHMDGETALKYARSRETTSDFDRSRRQQEIIKAVKEKLSQKESYTSIKKINQIINILQDDFKTDLQLSEIEGLVGLAKGTKRIYNKVLDDGADGFLYADNLDGMYVLMPLDGSLKEIHDFIKRYFKDPLLAEEESKIIVVNGSRNGYIVKNILGELSEVFNDVSEGESKDDLQEYPKTFIYDYTNGKKKYTSDFLADYFEGASIIKLNEKGAGSDFEIILGKDYLTKNK